MVGVVVVVFIVMVVIVVEENAVVVKVLVVVVKVVVEVVVVVFIIVGRCFGSGDVHSGSFSEPEPGYLAGGGAGAVTLARLRLHLTNLFNNSRKLYETQPNLISYLKET